MVLCIKASSFTLDEILGSLSPLQSQEAGLPQTSCTPAPDAIEAPNAAATVLYLLWLLQEICTTSQRT